MILWSEPRSWTKAMYWKRKLWLSCSKNNRSKDYWLRSSLLGVCYPRPYYMRNPYHLGFYLEPHWGALPRRESKFGFSWGNKPRRQRSWKRSSTKTLMQQMEHLVKTVTDFEFLRRFLPWTGAWVSWTDSVNVKYLQLRIPPDSIVEDRYNIWIDPEPIKNEMLNFFTHFHRQGFIWSIQIFRMEACYLPPRRWSRLRKIG